MPPLLVVAAAANIRLTAGCSTSLKMRYMGTKQKELGRGTSLPPCLHRRARMEWIDNSTIAKILAL